MLAVDWPLGVLNLGDGFDGGCGRGCKTTQPGGTQTTTAKRPFLYLEQAKLRGPQIHSLLTNQIIQILNKTFSLAIELNCGLHSHPIIVR